MFARGWLSTEVVASVRGKCSEKHAPISSERFEKFLVPGCFRWFASFWVFFLSLDSLAACSEFVCTFISPRSDVELGLELWIHCMLAQT